MAYRRSACFELLLVAGGCPLARHGPRHSSTSPWVSVVRYSVAVASDAIVGVEIMLVSAQPRSYPPAVRNPWVGARRDTERYANKCAQAAPRGHDAERVRCVESGNTITCGTVYRCTDGHSLFGDS